MGSDVAEQAMLDFVPLAGSRRKVANPDAQSGCIGQFLQLVFPQPRPVSVAASRISGDQ